MGLQFVTTSEKNWLVSGLVHRQKSCSGWYYTTFSTDCTSILSSSCVCLARKHAHNKCKHVAALLLAVFLLTHYLPPTPAPKWILSRKRKMSRFGDPGMIVFEEAKGSITYHGILDGFGQPPPSGEGGKPPLLILEPPKKKERKTERICVCQGRKGAKKYLVTCSGCGRIYHHNCVQKIHGAILNQGVLHCLLHKGCQKPVLNLPSLSEGLSLQLSQQPSSQQTHSENVPSPNPLPLHSIPPPSDEIILSPPNRPTTPSASSDHSLLHSDPISDHSLHHSNPVSHGISVFELIQDHLKYIFYRF